MPTIVKFLSDIWVHLQSLIAGQMSRAGIAGSDIPKLLLAGLVLLAVGTIVWLLYINIKIGVRTRARARDSRRSATPRYNPSPAIAELRTVTARTGSASQQVAVPVSTIATDILPPADVEERQELLPDQAAATAPHVGASAEAEPEKIAAVGEAQHELPPEEPATEIAPPVEPAAEVQADGVAHAVEEHRALQPDEAANAASTMQTGAEAPSDKSAELSALLGQLHETILSQKATIEELRGIVARQAEALAPASSSTPQDESADTQTNGAAPAAI